MAVEVQKVDPKRLGGTAEDQEKFLKWKQERAEEEARLIASGQLKPGDIPDELTEEDEEILDRVWAEE